MIREKGIVPSSLLCVTFTNKAAREMRERIGKALGTEIGNNPYRNHHLPMIGTFHSIGVVFLKEILARYSSEELGIGLKKDFIIYDETDKVAVLKSIIKEELQLDEKRYPPRQIAFYISNAKNALLSPKEYEQEVDSPIKEVVRDVYYKYEARLTQNNALDFDDILLKVYRLLSHEKILIQYQNRFQYIMVDEYQDTNAPQYHIIRLLAARHRNLAVVGDDWQSIYSWR
ncbi:MAG: UvrD-helicase domain-containing protein [Candidatus Peribacteria bacterium]|nr:MAG: UvrD-helicase domain-containing protein [Candidatus Peribacteria bacterium]